jgi:hypothetical protein
MFFKLIGKSRPTPEATTSDSSTSAMKKP